MKSLPLDDRPREKLASYGPGILSNSELLALILSSGFKDKDVISLSREILSEFSLDRLSGMDFSELKNIKGIGSAKACQLSACFEIGRRSSFTEGEKLKLDSSDRVFRLFGPRMEILKSEHFICLYVNSRKRLLKEKTLFVGTLDESVVHPREIFKVAFDEGAAGIILLHNHPSGNPSPSKEDLEFTKELVAAGELLGVRVLDHIIIGKRRYFSMVENDLI